MEYHKLKTWPEFFNYTLHGLKSFEIRKDDRDFKCGDFLILEEWDPETKKYTGVSLTRKISYILEGGRFGVPEGFVIMSLAMV